MAEAATTANPVLTADERKVIADAQAKTQGMMARVGVPGAQYKDVADVAKGAAARGEPVVTVLVPKPFILTLDGPDNEQVRFPKGIQQVPKALMSHWYVKVHKVEEYSVAATPAVMEPILGSRLFSQDEKIGDKVHTVSEINLAAFQASGLTPAQWNGLDDEKRGEIMIASLEARRAAGAAVAAK